MLVIENQWVAISLQLLRRERPNDASKKEKKRKERPKEEIKGKALDSK